MAKTSTYLHFPGTTEAAFVLYRDIFGGDFLGPIVRFDQAPPHSAQPLSAADKNLVLHIELAIVGGHVIMGSDAPESMGFQLSSGQQMHLNLELDSRQEAERIFNALSSQGTVITPLQVMFWGADYGCCVDRFGIRWMVNHTHKSND